MKTEALSQKQSGTSEYTFLFIFLASISFLGLQVERDETTVLLLTYGVAFFTYFWLVRLTHIRWWILVISGILTRALLFMDLPNLSDDFYRFIWDGVLLDHRINPYGILPGEALQKNIPELSQDFFNLLNSPNYYTIYPPLNQAIFWLSVKFGGAENILASVNVMRGVLLLADIGTFLLLRKILLHSDREPRLALWFFLNPLVILEFTGNLHFEGLVIFFLVLAIYFFKFSGVWGQGIGFAGAIATKLIPLIFLPSVLTKQWSWRGILVCGISLILAGITFIPLVSSALVNGMGSSIGLYFQSFEFNASIYFIIREIGFAVKGYNLIQKIGPWLAVSTFVFISTWSILGSWMKKDLSLIMLGSLVIYLLLSTTVHPWYVVPLIPLGLLSGYYFPIVWSLMIFLTYMGYGNSEFHLPMIWVALEYALVVGTFVIELKMKLKTK